MKSLGKSHIFHPLTDAFYGGLEKKSNALGFDGWAESPVFDKILHIFIAKITACWYATFSMNPYFDS